MHGLTFIALGYAAAGKAKHDREVRKARIRRLLSAGRKVSSDSDLSAEERAMLLEIEAQVQAARQRESTKTCPECKRHGIIVVIKDTEVDYCPFCRGCWFDPGELQWVTGLAKDIPSDDLKSRKSKYCCPVCQTLMTEYVFLKPHNLLVDRCPRGHGVYLENGELKRVFQIAGD